MALPPRARSLGDMFGGVKQGKMADDRKTFLEGTRKNLQAAAK